MAMSNGNHQYILLGFVSLVLVAEAFSFDFWHHDVDEDNTNPTYIQPHVSTVVVHNGPIFEEDETEGGIILIQEPAEAIVTPVKIETVQVQEKNEHLLHVVNEVPFGIRKIKFMSTTETVTLTENSLRRSTVVITPTVFKTETMVVQTKIIVNGNVISNVASTVTETELYVNTVLKTQRRYNTVSTPVVLYLTVEAQTIETVTEQYTLTTTERRIHTVWTTKTVDLENKSSIWIPIVEVETETTTIPYHITRTDWITLTQTTTVCKDW